MKKPRADAKLKTLPEGLQAELWALLNEAPAEGDRPMTYEQARAWLAEEHGVSTSSAALSEWYSWYGLALRTSRAKSRAAQAAAMAAKDDPDMSPEGLERVAQMIFTSEVIEEKDLKGFVALKNVSLRDRAVRVDERRIAMLEERARQADAAKAALEAATRSARDQGGLTEETLKRIEEAAGLL